MRFIGDISYAASFYCPTVNPRGRALAYLAHWMPKYIGGKCIFFLSHGGILSALSSYIFSPRAAMKSFFLVARGVLPNAPHSTISLARLKSPVLIRGNSYKLVHYGTLQIVAAVWHAALHPQLTVAVYQPSCLQASSPLPRGVTAIDSYRGRRSLTSDIGQVPSRIRGWCVRKGSRSIFLSRCAIPSDSLRLLNNMRNARKRESSRSRLK